MTRQRDLFPVIMAAGALMVVLGLRSGAPRSDAVLEINGVSLGVGETLRRMGAVEAEPEAVRQRLDAVVLEELMVQQALAMGLERSDPVVRRRLIGQVRELAMSEARGEEPDLEALYAARREDLRGSEILGLAWIIVEPAEAEGLEAGDLESLALTEEERPLDAWAERYGEPLRRVLRSTPVGEVTPAGPVPGGMLVARVDSRRAGEPLSYEEALPALRSWAERSRSEALLAEMAEELVTGAEVRVADDAVDRLITAMEEAD